MSHYQAYERPGSKTIHRLRRLGALPVMPQVAEVPYAKCRPELKGMTEGEMTRLILDSDAWLEVMVPVLDQLEASRPTKGPRPAYSSHELEGVLLFARVCGSREYRGTRDALAGDRHADARALLGLDAHRKSANGTIKLRAGLPSEATISRHKKRFGELARLQAYKALELRLRIEHLATPELQEEARILDIDGTKIETHYSGPIYEVLTDKITKEKYRTGKIVNEKRVTAPDAGYRPWSLGPDKGGHGWNLLTLTTATGVPVAWKMVKLHEGESTAALDFFKNEWVKEVAPYLASSEVRVLSTDGNFHKPELRAELRGLGILENTHLASHNSSPTTQREVAKRNRQRFLIQGYPDWFANGHRELVCRCGRGNVSRRVEKNGDRVVARVQGRCATCKTITITSGEWQTAENPARFVRCGFGEPAEDRDWAFGNPFTYNDAEAGKFGTARFGHNEGFHGALVSRFQLIKGKRWFRRAAQAEIDIAMTFSIMHALALEQRKRARAAPPPLAVAA